MSLPDIDSLAAAINDPDSLARLNLAQWDLLIRQARNADVLAKIAMRSERMGLFDRFPAQPRRHLQSAVRLALRQMREVRSEVASIELALAPTQESFVLLKGAAYALAGLRSAEGRMMSDVDILVRKEALPFIESALMLHGWSSTARSAYDQRYYRAWMHELPPMQHIHRATTIDVHHAILPVTSRSHPSSPALLSQAQPLSPGRRVCVLGPVDMFLHSATHLFHEGEFQQGFRGVVDLDSLLRELGVDEQFWRQLVARAEALELTRPLFYALRYTRALLNTPIPEDALIAVSKSTGARQPGIGLSLMDALFLRALRPAHATTSDKWTPLARWLLYVRGHWLRMPPLMLAVHLIRKSVMPKPKPEPQTP